MSEPICPKCGEPVKPAWRLCPACETRLQAPVCPRCRAEVKETWRRCPECEAFLLCPDCGSRLTQDAVCPKCGADDTASARAPFTDPVCGIEFVPVKGGPFSMGDTLGEGIATELPVHEVILDDFYISRFPVTQASWARLMPENPSARPNPEAPVEQVSWEKAREFARRLTEAAGSEWVFDLPSEAQWEFAARNCGEDVLYAGGENIDALAWYGENSGGRPHPVGKKKPNGLGLFDMSGNVWEWCLDTFQIDAYGSHDRKNPVVTEPGPDRVIRGGGWNLDAWSARCARRFNFSFDSTGPALGFRLVMTLPGLKF